MKGLFPEYIKNIQKSIIRELSNKKRIKYLKIHFTKGDTYMANKYIKNKHMIDQVLTQIQNSEILPHTYWNN